jgi:VCBS repeat-containing protein
MGTTNPPPGTYAAQEGATTVVGAFPSPGYELKNWTLDGQTVPKTDNSIAVTMDKDHALTANFGPVAAPPFDFTVEVNPTSATIKQGETATATVTVTLSSGTAQTVTLSASGLPADATATFNPQSGTPTFQSTLTITTAKTTPAGTYNITITGTGGGLTRTATFTLTVTQLPTYKLTIAGKRPKDGNNKPSPRRIHVPRRLVCNSSSHPQHGLHVR